MDSVFVEGLQCVKWKKPLEFKAVGVNQSEVSEEYSLLAGNPV